MKRPISNLFVTEADYHRPECLKGAELRAYILMQCLFFDQVVVGDTQFNNNRWLRALISPDEPDEGLPESAPRDFRCLVADGHIVPALRSEYASLDELRQEHVKRCLKAAPSEEYTRWVSELLAGRRITYRVEEVSYVFKQRMLEELAVPSNLPSVTEQTRLEFYEFAIQQEPLLFHGLLDWMKARVQQGTLSKVEFEAIDVLIDNCYRHNIGFAIDANVDFLASRLDHPGLMALSFGDGGQARVRPPESFSKEVTLPPYAFLAAD